MLLALLARRINDEGILWLCGILMEQALVPGIDAAQRRGLPIGNLTSQFWANVYLDPLDQIVVRLPGVRAYLRYMDDLLLFGDDKPSLWAAERVLKEFTAGVLHLTIKDRVTTLAPVTEGIPWLGFRVYPGLVRLDQSSKGRFVHKLHASIAQAALMLTSEEPEVARAASLCGHVAHANTRHFRRSLLFDTVPTGAEPQR